MRSKYVFNFFVLGNQKTLERVLRVSDRQGMFKIKRSWYSLSLSEALLDCHHCKNLTILSFLPHSVAELYSSKLKNEHYPLYGYYYEIANLMRSLVKVKPVQLNTCEDFDQHQTNINSSNFQNLSNKYESVLDDFHRGPDEPYPISMDMKLIKFQDENVTSQFLGIFKADMNQSITVRSEKYFGLILNVVRNFSDSFFRSPITI